MYIVTIKNGNETTTIHGYEHKLSSGKIVKGINTIDSFTFTILPSNPGFNKLFDYKTTIKVYNTNRNKYEFYGRVLCSNPSMSESGLISKDITCESYLGYLCDSTFCKNQLSSSALVATTDNFFRYIFSHHNSIVEEGKYFVLGDCIKKNTGLLSPLELDVESQNTWDIIKKHILDKIGGEIRYHVEEKNGIETIYLDYADAFGEEKTTTIELSKNMKSISKEQDSSTIITRLLPLGAKIGEEDSGIRVTIPNYYVDDKQGIANYGIICGTVLFDDITDRGELKAAADEWLSKNNKVSTKYAVTALDLSLLGLAFDDFDIYNIYPIKNKLLNIEDKARITKKTIDICEETKSTIEFGEGYQTASGIQRSQTATTNSISKEVTQLKNDVTRYVTVSELNTAVDEAIERAKESGELSGEDGISVTGARISNGELIFNYSDGTITNLGKVVGDDGKNGNGIKNIRIEEVT